MLLSQNKPSPAAAASWVILLLATAFFIGCGGGDSSKEYPAETSQKCIGDIPELSYPENSRELETFYSEDVCTDWRSVVPTPSIPWGLPEESPISELIAKYLLIQSEPESYDRYWRCALFELAEQSDLVTAQLRSTYDEIPHHNLLPREELTNFLGVLSGQEEVIDLLQYIALDPAPIDPEFYPLIGGEEGAREAKDLQGMAVVTLGRTARIVDGVPDPRWVNGLAELVVHDDASKSVKFLATAQLRSIGVTASQFSELVAESLPSEEVEELCEFAY